MRDGAIPRSRSGGGGRNDKRINEFLQAPVNEAFAHWNLDFAAEELRQTNFQVVDAREEYPVTRFYDVGAVYYLRMMEWQVPGFTASIRSETNSSRPFWFR